MGIQKTHEAISVSEAGSLAQEAWIFGMPLVYIEIQIDTMTHTSRNDGAHAPMNQFVHYRELADASNRTVVGLNVDTLYSLAQLDLSQEPLMLSVPRMGDRFWVIQIVDAWNNVPHAPGSRTVGSEGGKFAMVGPRWKGTLPHGVAELRVPTALALLAGRTYTGGRDDYAAVHALQDQYRLSPLSRWGQPYTPPDDVPLKAGVDTETVVPKQVLAMTPEDFFRRLNRLLATNPPEPDDPETMKRIARLGIGPDVDFRMDAFSPEIRTAIGEGIANGISIMRETPRGKLVNGWQIALDMGRYGTNYTYRAGWTFYGVGGNLAEDAVYPLAEVDAQSKPLNSRNRYLLRFTKASIPPVNAFWSLTMYDRDAFLVPNPINRFALGDRSTLAFGSDGSLTLHIQSSSPGPDKESNWLPAPENDDFKLALRLYAPKKEVADGTWKPPALERVE